MPLHNAQAFVLRTYKLAEADKICVLLTRQSGKIRGVAYGARKLKSRFGSCLEPFTEISLTYFEKEGRELVSISNAEIVRSHYQQAADSVIAGAGMSYISDLCCEFLPDHEPSDTVYRLLTATLEAFGALADATSLVRYFEVWMLKLSGFYPNLRRCSGCDAAMAEDGDVWLSGDGAPQCFACSSGRGVRVTVAVRATIARILAEPPALFAQSPPPLDHLDRLSEISLLIIRHLLERDLKSFAIFNRLRRDTETS